MWNFGREFRNQKTSSLSPSCIHVQNHQNTIITSIFIEINTLIHNLSGNFKRINDILLSFHMGIKYWKTRNVQLAPEGCPSPSAPRSHGMQWASDLHSKMSAPTTDARSRVKCLGMFSAGQNGKTAISWLKLKVRTLLKEQISHQCSLFFQQLVCWCASLEILQ